MNTQDIFRTRWSLPPVYPHVQLNTAQYQQAGITSPLSSLVGLLNLTLTRDKRMRIHYGYHGGQK
ncbi:Uncharacterized protein YP598_3772 [Yersinia pseudotuberculosis]|uniref:Uncharacterized protein n=1 Tax=Yersinia similis TaxID=367190 RepID=A0A0T9RNV0_9GAMM|nr:hypothetical protein DJ55_1696 [Yersinia pseudotuberculosis]CNI74232.1 Uncharacterised protein [Yersinia similis]UFA63386.1 Uncharacterized protein YP598_3772 [Yersinia pseudotuberculosis]CNE38860.1 Uncharacterised protein [Yersinia pseudotuberculosis]CNE74867.1 Uncharacterised protein [Yersinia pseudotuberculosis]